MNLKRLSSKKPSGLFSLPSGVRGGMLEAVEYEDLEFGKLLGESHAAMLPSRKACRCPRPYMHDDE